ncbi:MAG: galactitol system component [Chloroflexota bacterium]|nr:galactitol system component [Chloroflexota bacterium]
MPNTEEFTLADFTIDEKLILVNEDAATPEEIIRKLGGLLFENGFVKDSYTQAVLDREQVYPTGLQARKAGVAIPHTDTEHVLKPAIAIATLSKPITFQMMATPEEKVQVEIVIMLAVHDAKLVIPVLRKVIFILENDEALVAMKNAETKSQVKQAMIKHIESMQKKS